MVSKYGYSSVFSVFQVPFRGMLHPYRGTVKIRGTLYPRHNQRFCERNNYNLIPCLNSCIFKFH